MDNRTHRSRFLLPHIDFGSKNGFPNIEFGCVINTLKCFLHQQVAKTVDFQFSNSL